MAVLYLHSYNLPSTTETGIARVAVSVKWLNYSARQRWSHRKTSRMNVCACGASTWVCEAEKKNRNKWLVSLRHALVCWRVCAVRMRKTAGDTVCSASSDRWDKGMRVGLNILIGPNSPTLYINVYSCEIQLRQLKTLLSEGEMKMRRRDLRGRKGKQPPVINPRVRKQAWVIKPTRCQ